jgi:flagellar basal-body rod protein FlgF
MDPLTAAAASGLRSRMESLDLLANNLANTNSPGFKSDREFYGVYRAVEADGSDSVMPLVERHWTDFSQGALAPTGNPLDLALSGHGFFAIDGPSGPLYTRNGNFRLSPAGRMITEEGYPVRASGGAGLILSPGRSIEIAADGTVQQDGQVIGRLELVDFTSTAGLAKQGRTYFRSGDPAAVAPAPSGAAVQQGKLEAANVGSAESAVRLVNVMRQFEMLQKAVGLGAEMNRRAIEEVARVGA